MLRKIKTWIRKILPSHTEFDDVRLVFKTREHHLISIMKLKLEEEGIQVYVINKMDSAYNNFGEIELYVSHEDVVKAKYIIEKSYE